MVTSISEVHRINDKQWDTEIEQITFDSPEGVEVRNFTRISEICFKCAARGAKHKAPTLLEIDVDLSMEEGLAPNSMSWSL